MYQIAHQEVKYAGQLNGSMGGGELHKEISNWQPVDVLINWYLYESNFYYCYVSHWSITLNPHMGVEDGKLCSNHMVRSSEQLLSQVIL